MKKVIIIVQTIIILLIIGFILLNVYVNSLLKEGRERYYEKTCNFNKNQNLSALINSSSNSMINKCLQTRGCFKGCGSACPQKQRLSFSETFEYFYPEICIAVCAEVCVCPYGQEFDSLQGCKPI